MRHLSRPPATLLARFAPAPADSPVFVVEALRRRRGGLTGMANALLRQDGARRFRSGEE
jgi:hypothetical protein